MRVNKKSDLPKWFNLSNYDVFSSMTDAELFYQLSARWDIHAFSDLSEMNEIESLIGCGVIKDAKERSDSLNREMLRSLSEYSVLPRSGGVETLSIWGHYGIHAEVLKFEDGVDESIKSDMLRFLYRARSVNTFMDEDFKNNLYLKIDLDWPDNLLIEDMKELLPLWREALNVKPAIDHQGYAWDIVRKKIVDYSLMPLIDLIIWQKKSECKITNGVLAVSVYPEGDYDATNIAQTIKPNLERIFNFFSIEKCRRELVDRRILGECLS